jgi:hypothetical protein
MATKNMPLAKSAGWVVVSTTANIFVSNPNSQALEYCWSDAEPGPLFRPHTLHPSHGVARDFETGALRMKNNSSFEEVTIVVDEA